MRISYWSSDVCSSDLGRGADRRPVGVGKARLLQQFADAFSLVAGPGSGDGRAQRGGLRRQFGGQDGGHGAPRQVRPAILGLARAREQPCAQGSRSRSEEHTSELQSLMRISYAVFCLNKTKLKQIK